MEMKKKKKKNEKKKETTKDNESAVAMVAEALKFSQGRAEVHDVPIHRSENKTFAS